MNCLKRRLNAISEFERKGYDRVEIDDTIYLHWTSKADHLLEPGFNWGDIFDQPNLIAYSSSSRLIDESEDQDNFGNFYKLTGFVRPFFLEFQVEDKYDATLTLFEIEPGQSIDMNKFLQIDMYKQSLHKQLKRQLKYIRGINKDIGDVLKVFYFEAKQLLLNGQQEDYKREEWESRNAEWKMLFYELKLFYAAAVIGMQRSYNFDDVERILDTCKQLNPHLKTAISSGVIQLGKEREPAVAFTRTLIGKINPIESILEDIHMHNRLKTRMQYDEQKKASRHYPVEWKPYCIKYYEENKEELSRLYDARAITREIISNLKKKFPGYPYYPDESTIRRNWLKLTS